MQKEFTR